MPKVTPRYRTQGYRRLQWQAIAGKRGHFGTKLISLIHGPLFDIRYRRFVQRLYTLFCISSPARYSRLSCKEIVDLNQIKSNQIIYRLRFFQKIMIQPQPTPTTYHIGALELHTYRAPNIGVITRTLSHRRCIGMDFNWIEQNQIPIAWSARRKNGRTRKLNLCTYALYIVSKFREKLTQTWVANSTVFFLSETCVQMCRKTPWKVHGALAEFPSTSYCVWAVEFLLRNEKTIINIYMHICSCRYCRGNSTKIERWINSICAVDDIYNPKWK